MGLAVIVAVQTVANIRTAAVLEFFILCVFQCFHTKWELQ